MNGNYSQIFDHFQSQGGIADLSELDEDVKIFWQLPLRYLQDALAPARISPLQPDKEFPSYLSYINNNRFNAVIRHEEKSVAVGVYAGLPMIAFQACRLFALRMDQATGLPRCDERERLVVYDERITLPTEWSGYHNSGSEAHAELLRFEENTELENNLLATFMFDLAMRYVAMHECMHFVLGHARFCQKVLGLDAFEDGSKHREALDPITNQTLEFIADRHTIAGLVCDLDEGRLFHEWSRGIPDFVSVPQKIWHRRILIATVALISRLWKSHGAETFGDLSNAYPHPYERVCWMVCALSEMEKDKKLANDFDVSLALAVCSLDRNFETSRQDFPLIERDYEIFKLLGSSSVDYGYDVVRARAVEIQKKLFKEFGPYYPNVE